MIEIRSYRRVFDLERRLYSIDQLRLNPSGVPVRGMVYFLAAVSLAVVFSATPLLGAMVKAVPWYLRDLIGPAAIASVLSVIRVDGRTFHLAARGLCGMLAGPRSISRLTSRSMVGACWAVPELILLPDGSDSRLRRLRYRGPGAVLVQVAHERRGVSERGRVGLAGTRTTMQIAGLDGARRPARGQVIALRPGGQVVIVPSRTPSAR